MFGIATAGAYVMDRTSGLLWRKERTEPDAAPNAFDPPPLTDRDLQAIVRLVYEKSGITLHEGKRALITARLQKRLRETGVRSFAEYLTVVERDHTGGELVVLLDSIATNHTSFFREPEHFQFLTQKVVPEWATANPGAPLEVWSAACSSGEEPYTLAVALLRLAAERRQGALPHPGVGSVDEGAADRRAGRLQDGARREHSDRDAPAPLRARHGRAGRARAHQRDAPPARGVPAVEPAGDRHRWTARSA